MKAPHKFYKWLLEAESHLKMCKEFPPEKLDQKAFQIYAERLKEVIEFIEDLVLADMAKKASKKK